MMVWGLGLGLAPGGGRKKCFREWRLLQRGGVAGRLETSVALLNMAWLNWASSFSFLICTASATISCMAAAAPPAARPSSCCRDRFAGGAPSATAGLLLLPFFGIVLCSAPCSLFGAKQKLKTTENIDVRAKVDKPGACHNLKRKHLPFFFWHKLLEPLEFAIPRFVPLRCQLDPNNPGACEPRPVDARHRQPSTPLPSCLFGSVTVNDPSHLPHTLP